MRRSNRSGVSTPDVSIVDCLQCCGYVTIQLVVWFGAHSECRCPLSLFSYFSHRRLKVGLFRFCEFRFDGSGARLGSDSIFGYCFLFTGTRSIFFGLDHCVKRSAFFEEFVFGITLLSGFVECKFVFWFERTLWEKMGYSLARIDCGDSLLVFWCRGRGFLGLAWDFHASSNGIEECSVCWTQAIVSKLRMGSGHSTCLAELLWVERRAL